MFFLDHGQTNQARQQLELAAIEQAESPLTFDAFGRLALIEGRITDAAVLFDLALRLMQSKDWNQERKDRFSRECELGLATVAERRGQWSSAQQILQTALDRQPQDPVTRRRLAQALFRTDQIESAFQQLLKTTEIDPSLESAEITMARFCTGQGDHAQAEQWINKALEKNPEDDSVIVVYGSWLLDRGRDREAVEQARRATKIAPGEPRVKSLLGTLARTLGKCEHAERYFQELANAEPGNFDFSNQLALSLIDQSDPQKQQRALQLAEGNARQYPRNEQALATLGWVYHRLGRVEDAAQMIQRAISSGRASADTAYFYARVAAEQNRTGEAVELLQRALQSDGRFVYRNAAQQWLQQLSAAGEPKGEPETP